MSFKSYLRRAANMVLGPFGLELSRKLPILAHDWSNTKDYIPFEETVAKAREAGLSVGDYIDSVYNKPGATQFTIDQMASFGIFQDRIATVCEIGPGSGRYLEKVMRMCRPARYEIYETARKWAAYLIDTYGAVLQPTDGRTLAPTVAGSIDLVQAHKVFPSIPFMTACAYLAEMARVVKRGGYVVCDILSESCLENDVVERWLASGVQHHVYPAPVPRKLAVGILQRRGCSLIGSFQVPMEPGTTECLIFKKLAAGTVEESS